MFQRRLRDGAYSALLGVLRIRVVRRQNRRDRADDRAGGFHDLALLGGTLHRRALGCVGDVGAAGANRGVVVDCVLVVRGCRVGYWAAERRIRFIVGGVIWR